MSDGLHDGGSTIEPLFLWVALEDPTEGIAGDLKRIGGFLLYEVQHFAHSVLVVINQLLCAVRVIRVGGSVGGADQCHILQRGAFFLRGDEVTQWVRGPAGEDTDVRRDSREKMVSDEEGPRILDQEAAVSPRVSRGMDHLEFAFT